ncbi:uncharacterized protein SAPINGB_P004810 [Magnusiomyces paraingens]|uniref:Oxysterol-binding protein n=1 Tax=Magnusiomyces paraingens TaxID=2606893 RepID=A0A5E8BWT4_9ASCO|nr:uncharacterized protein SAPINGB_P004810 [Saprochaete ingens]VVT56099.1 unnamed protein product [Saprochaete ingens]
MFKGIRSASHSIISTVTGTGTGAPEDSSASAAPGSSGSASANAGGHQHIHHHHSSSAAPATSSGTSTSPKDFSYVDPEDIDEVDDQGQNILMGIISQLRFGSDLSRITLPTFILERKSMLERITNQFQHPDILLEAHTTKDPEARFIKVVKWSLSGWHITPKAVKKPLNPVLGEYFSSWWDLSNGTRAYYIAEQTSHHPPKTSYFYISPENNIRIDGTLVPHSKFLGNSAASIMEGVGFLQFMDIIDSKTKNPELYEITQPNMYARGILIGKLKYELGDHSIIRCPALDLVADIEFKTKGFISGTYNAIQGEIKQISTGKVLYEITGKWNEIMEIRNVKTKEKSVLFDTFTANPQPTSVRPLDEQGHLESRRLWHKVIIALGKRDHETATTEKSKIEDKQRVEARVRAEEGVEFHPKLFKPVHSPVGYRIYKDFDGKTPAEQIKLVEEIMPILPGQKFRDNFEMPAYEKHMHGDDNADLRDDTEEEESTKEDCESCQQEILNKQGPLDQTEDLKQALP